MKARDLKEKFINFFIAQKHIEIPSANLTPENDPTTLFISAGMHPLVPYLLGQPHPLGKRLTDVQKCVRTGDIDEVGDETHHTFFEMLGNWSLGDYGKKEAITWSFEFLTKHLNFDTSRLSVTCFEGDENSPKDEESANIWRSLGVNNIKFLRKKDNWWGPAGSVGPCGPDTEMFIDGVEMWNDVFMQYYKDEAGNYKIGKQFNVDTGMGVERTTSFSKWIFGQLFIRNLATNYQKNRRNFAKNHIQTTIIKNQFVLLPTTFVLLFLSLPMVLNQSIKKLVMFSVV